MAAAAAAEEEVLVAPNPHRFSMTDPTRASAYTWIGANPWEIQHPPLDFGAAVIQILAQVHPRHRITLGAVLALEDLLHDTLQRVLQTSAMACPAQHRLPRDPVLSGTAIRGEHLAAGETLYYLHTPAGHNPQGDNASKRGESGRWEAAHTLTPTLDPADGEVDLVAEWNSLDPDEKESSWVDCTLAWGSPPSSEAESTPCLDAPVTWRAVVTAIRVTLPNECAKHAVSEGFKARAACAAAGCHEIEPEAADDAALAEATGLHVSPACVGALASRYTGARVTLEAAVTLAATLQYLAEEVLELGGNHAIEVQRSGKSQPGGESHEAEELAVAVVDPRCVLMGIRCDQELDEMYPQHILGSGWSDSEHTRPSQGSEMPVNRPPPDDGDAAAICNMLLGSPDHCLDWRNGANDRDIVAYGGAENLEASMYNHPFSPEIEGLRQLYDNLALTCDEYSLPDVDTVAVEARWARPPRRMGRIIYLDHAKLFGPQHFRCLAARAGVSAVGEGTTAAVKKYFRGALSAVLHDAITRAMHRDSTVVTLDDLVAALWFGNVPASVRVFGSGRVGKCFKARGAPNLDPTSGVSQWDAQAAAAKANAQAAVAAYFADPESAVDGELGLQSEDSAFSEKLERKDFDPISRGVGPGGCDKDDGEIDVKGAAWEEVEPDDVEGTHRNTLRFIETMKTSPSPVFPFRSFTLLACETAQDYATDLTISPAGLRYLCEAIELRLVRLWARAGRFARHRQAWCVDVSDVDLAVTMLPPVKTVWV